jgi:diguanylate cyclase (GGDEF)-like protein/excisionase family DNA binding protein
MPLGTPPAIQFRDLQFLLILLEERHFARAAERFGIAEPELSATLSRLAGITDGVRVRERLERRIGQQRSIAALERRALNGTSLAGLMEATVEAVAVHLPAEQAAVLEVRGGALVPLALTAAAPWPLEALATGLDAPLPADIVSCPGGLSAGAFDGDSALPAAWRAVGVRTAMIAGIARREEGEAAILVALDTDIRGLDEHDLEFLQAAAGVLASAAQRRVIERELRHRALHDRLTGLPNRTLFHDRLERATERAAREGTMVAVALVDVDRFKNVNDAVGHLAGDELLRGVARRLAGAARPGDTIARFGGDEFAVLSEDVGGEREATALAEALLGALDEPLTVHDRTVAARVSVGVALASHPAEAAPNGLIRNAGVALFRAKEGGGGRIELFQAAMRRRLLLRVNVEEELRRALERDELTLAFQPVVDLAARRIASLETRLRWEHPRRGALPPGELLDVAETSGLAAPIGRYLLTSVCRQVARWRADPTLVVPEVSMHISARQLAGPGFVEEVARVLGSSGVSGGQIALEVRETELLDDGGVPTSALEALRRLGVRIVLDDFGSGWSSLSDLKRFPIAGLKIDRALIGGLADGEEERHIVRAVVGLAHALELFVVAKGVQTPAVAHAAMGLGCTLAQGALFARPVAAPVIEAMLRDGLDMSGISEVVAGTMQERSPVEAVPSESVPAARSTVALSEAAEALCVSASTLRRWADSGRLRVVRTAGGHRRFAAEDVRRLRRETVGLQGPLLRPARLPETPIPHLASLFSEQGGDLLRRATSLLYEPGRGGWFAGLAGTGHLETWLGAVRAAAAGVVGWDSAIDATVELATRAHHGDAAQVEGHILLERIDDLVQFRLHERRASPAALAQVRLLFRALHRAIVDTGPDATG